LGRQLAVLLRLLQFGQHFGATLRRDRVGAQEGGAVLAVQACQLAGVACLQQFGDDLLAGLGAAGIGLGQVGDQNAGGQQGGGKMVNVFMMDSLALKQSGRLRLVDSGIFLLHPWAGLQAFDPRVNTHQT
jgi:hypothetical protein